MAYNKVIKSDDSQAFGLLLENKEFFEQRNAYMKTVNDYYKAHGTVAGCPGIEDDTARELDARVTDDQHCPYPVRFSYENHKQIQQIDKMLARLTENPETLFKGWLFHGGEAIVNLANNRLQLMFDEKPGEQQRKELYKNGFRFAYKSTAWQRPLSHKAISAADRLDFIKPSNGQKPSELQPKAPKRNEPER